MYKEIKPVLAGRQYGKNFQGHRTLQGPFVSLVMITLNRIALYVWVNVNLFWDFSKFWIPKNLLPSVDIVWILVAIGC